MSKRLNKFGRVLALTPALLLGALAAQGAAAAMHIPAGVTLSHFFDSDGDKDTGYNAPSTASGADAMSAFDLVVNNFIADSTGSDGGFAKDAIRFRINAPTGLFISEITFTYSETLTSILAAGSVNGYSASATVGGEFFNLGGAALFGGGVGSTMVPVNTMPLTVSFPTPLKWVNINIDNSLFSANGGSIEKTASSFELTDVQVVPVPPAVWLLGSALVGLVTVGRMKHRNA